MNFIYNLFFWSVWQGKVQPGTIIQLKLGSKKYIFKKVKIQTSLVNRFSPRLINGTKGCSDDQTEYSMKFLCCYTFTQPTEFSPGRVE